MNANRWKRGMTLWAAVVFLTGGSAATAGTIVGKVVLEGDYTIAGKVTLDADSLIRAKRAAVVSEQGGLANVVVSLEGVPGQFSPPAEPAVLDQREKTFVPHVLPILKGQQVKVLNSDGILHNLHGYNGKITLFNMAMPAFRKEVAMDIATEDAQEVAMMACDVHSHMRAWIVIRDNPFFATSPESGLFTIESAPEGTFTIRAWHEKFGSLEQRITVKPGDEKTPVIFKFQAQ